MRLLSIVAGSMFAATAQADVASPSPTGVSEADLTACAVEPSGEAHQRCLSQRTLRELHRLVYNCATYEECTCAPSQPGCTVGRPYPGGARTIRLGAGVYDFGAAMYVDPPASPPPDYTLSPLFGLYLWNPLRHDPAALGLAISGRDNLILEGTVAADGTLLTHVLGNGDPRVLGDPIKPAVYANSVLMITGLGSGSGADDRSSRNVVVRNLSFERAGRYVFIGAAAPKTDPENPPLVTFGQPPVDVRVENNAFRMDGRFGVGVNAGVRTAIRKNRFYRAPGPDWDMVPIEVIGIGQRPPFPIDTLVEDNTLLDVLDGILLWDQQRGTIVRRNIVQARRVGIFQVSGSHRSAPPFPPDSGGSIIEENTISAEVGIILWSGFGWTVRHNRASGCAIGVWIDWFDMFFAGPDNVVDTADDIVRFTPPERNVIGHNDLRGNGLGVLVGTYVRNNVFISNRVGDNPDGGYVLLPPDEEAGAGRPAGNVFTGLGAADSVVDLSGCSAGPDGCPQVDYDGDGAVNEDPVDGLDNDGDGVVDEAPLESPNVFIGFSDRPDRAAVSGPGAVPRDHPGEAVLVWR